MEPYLVFGGMNDSPSGGWGDFVGSADTMDDALALVQPDFYWWHIVHEEHIVQEATS